ncbi:MAG: AAA family ATPase [Candidatus Gracilibacteria bacterium]|nr:AAA family ATPase [Candidatus Gracilibacteria bacterium]
MNNLIQSLLKYQNNLLKSISLNKKRFLYDDIPNNERLVGIVGLRGVGKTTILLQKLKENKDFDKSIYFSLDNPKVSLNGLFNLVDEMYTNFGYTYFYIDEIHKYKNWNQELKNIYDSFPGVNILFSGSSSVDIIKGTYDLSRRVLLYKLPNLSFREYLNLKYKLDLKKYSIDEIFNNPIDIYKDFLKYDLAILKEFREYLINGEFPFFIGIDQINYSFKIENIINKIIYEDIASFYQLKTQNLFIFKEIIYFIINSEPGLFSYNSLSKYLSISGETLKSYIEILKEIGLIELISFEGNISQEIRKSKKIYFMINNLNYSESYINSNNVGRIRETFLVKNVNYILKSGIRTNSIKYSDKGDFVITLKNSKYILEVGGKNKTNKQIQGIANSFLVKDDISEMGNSIIPLRLFGFLY